ncbi:MAG: hypothetical protein ABI197_12120 [Granulicella sp.]
MTNKKAHEEAEELKEFDAHVPDAVPAPEDGGHSHSHAAHLGTSAHENTKPAGGLKHGVTLGELREPPQVTGRVGKEHRKQ